jgi:hypothetical protein
MGGVARAVSYILPATCGIGALQDVMIRGEIISGFDLLGLLVISVWRLTQLTRVGMEAHPVLELADRQGEPDLGGRAPQYQAVGMELVLNRVLTHAQRVHEGDLG